MLINKENRPPIQLGIDPRIRNHNRSLSFILAKTHPGYFRISLSFGCQALLYEKLCSQSPRHQTSLLLVWILSIFVFLSLSILYVLKCLFHRHHVGLNHLFTPFISCLILLRSAPKWLIPPTTPYYSILYWIFTIPIIFLDVKIYGQWLTSEKKLLAKMANPTSQISVLGNLIAAQLAAYMSWKETALCLFSLGMAHYLVLFVTLYQSLSDGDRFPMILRPVFSLFFAVPSVSSVAWSSISGAYDIVSKMLFFLSLFIFTSLVCRPNLFRKSMRRFSVALWAYSFPLSFLALASIEYAMEVKGHFALGLMIFLSGFSVAVFVALLLFTVLNLFKLFRENDPMLNSWKEPS